MSEIWLGLEHAFLRELSRSAIAQNLAWSG